MDIKLVAFDLDGTILKSDKSLSERNRRALEDCEKIGVHIVPATGRIVTGIPDEIKKIPGLRYAITINGAVVIDMDNGEVISSSRLKNAVAVRIMKLANENHIMYDAYVGGRGISERRFYDHLDQHGIPQVLQKMVHDTREVVPDVIQYMEETGLDAEKVNMFFADLSKRKQMRERLAEIPGIIVSSSLENNLEINAAEATKGNGIARLSAYLGLKKEQTMALGDGENDLDMIESCKIGVAMSNGDSCLKAKADYVTLTNDEDGAAVAIEKFILKR